MSTKTTTDSKNTLNYDSKSKGIYDSLTGSGSNFLQDLIKNPFSNPSYKLGLGQSQRGAQAQGQNSIQALLSQMRTSGMSGNSGNAFQMAQTAKAGRASAGMMSQANIQNIFQALSRQQGAAGQAMAFSPLLTGESGHSTQQQGGLGTWLPQLLGAGLGAAGSMFTGGMSGGMGGIMSGAKSLPASSPFGLGGNSGSMFPGFNQASPFGH